MSILFHFLQMSLIYCNSQFATNCYTVVLYYQMFKYFFVQKISFATFGVSIDPFFYVIHWSGLQPNISLIFDLSELPNHNGQ